MLSNYEPVAEETTSLRAAFSRGRSHLKLMIKISDRKLQRWEPSLFAPLFLLKCCQHSVFAVRQYRITVLN